jgi:hypothetical protein
MKIRASEEPELIFKFFISYQKFGPKNGKIPKAPQCLIFRGVIELKVVNTQSVEVHIQ